MSQRRALVLEIWCGEAAAAGTAFVLDWLAGWLSWLGCSACAGGAGGGGGGGGGGVAWRGVAAAGSEPLKPYLA